MLVNQNNRRFHLNKKFRYFHSVVLVMIFFGFGVFGQNNVADLFSDRGEIYFRFTIEDPSIIGNISKTISVSSVKEMPVCYGYANKDQFKEFLKLNIDYLILPPPGNVKIDNMREKVDLKEIQEWDFYPTYDAYVDMMYQFEASHPDICDVFSIGQSNQGRELLFAKISDNINSEEGEPRFLYTSSMHGDELTGFILMMRLIDHLLENYGQDTRITDIINNTEIWINPLANPDGTYHSGNHTVSGATRFNFNNVDLNRNYADPEDGPHPDGNPWQKETIEYMELADSVSFVMGANLHTGAEVCN